MKTFKEITDREKGLPPKTGCTVCGKKKVGIVRIEIVDANSAKFESQIAIRGESLCELHAVKLYEELDRVMGKVKRL